MIYKKKQVFAAACIGLLLFGIILITLGSILPSLRDKFKIDELHAGKLTLILAFGILIGSLVFGPVADRHGYKILLVTTSLLVGLAFQGLAFAESWFLIQVSIFIIGFAGGIINGATNAMVADISTGDKGANLSLLGVFFGIGALGMPLLLGILSKQIQYQSILSFTGLFMLLPVVYFTGIKFPVPKQSKGFPVKEGIKLIKEPILLLISFFLFFQSGTEALVNNWITTFLQTELKSTQENSLFILSCFVGGLTVSRLLLGFILKKISSYNVMLASLLITAAGSLLLFYAGTFTIALIAMVIIGVGLAAGFPVMLGYTGHLYPNLSATAFSIALVIALIGNMLINYFFGFMSNKYGVSRLPVFLLAGIACMFVLLLFIRSRISKIENIK